MDIFMDMMSDQDTPFSEVVENGKPNSYYQGLGIHILKQIDTNEHYFHFLQSILSNFENLEEGLAEILRVLKPNGIFVILETSLASDKTLPKLLRTRLPSGLRKSE